MCRGQRCGGWGLRAGPQSRQTAGDNTRWVKSALPEFCPNGAIFLPFGVESRLSTGYNRIGTAGGLISFAQTVSDS